ncbi:peptide ABC transporter substrate-binding protein [Streptococcus sp. ZJ151]|uniref:peptide ABC transporter substrate-binding protein n=1 Tax=Streptococcus jiangjianxini TaxID=3161189 RepID=UPI0032EFEA48
MTSKKKLMVLAGVALVSTSVLAACGNQSGSKKSGDMSYSYVYPEEPKTLDYTVANASGTSDLTSNFVDGLLENDRYGNLIPSLAKDWTVSKDGLTYTYKLRDDAYWYTADGEEYAPVTAEDFVTGLKHAADEKSDALYVVEDSVKGLKDYLDGKIKDFKEVGVKAIDEHTVQYTLNKPESFWNSKTTYGILFPVNGEFLKSKGKNFGAPTDPSSLLYNGPYTLSAITSKSSVEMTKNENYWDAKNVHITNVKLTYSDGSDPDALFNNFKDGSYSYARLYPNQPSYKKASKDFGKNIYYTQQNASTFMYFFNVNRTANKMTSKTPEQIEDTKAALQNKDFRQAVTFAFDRASWNSQVSGEEAKDKALRNTLVPPTFVQIDGKDFGDTVTSELEKLGDEWKGVDLTDAQNGLYNPEKAKAELEKAKASLGSDVTYPIQIDTVVSQTDELGVQRAKSLKQSVEANLGKENVQVNVLEKSEEEYLAATYEAESAEQMDYDITISGWSPDYLDPSSYLDIFSTEEGAASTMRLGVDAKNKEIIDKVGLNEYQAHLDKAAAISDDVDARYTEYAKAQAWLSDSALVIPSVSLGGAPSVSRIQPFSAPFSWVGTKGGGTNYKYQKLLDKPVTAEAYQKALESWKAKREKSNEKATKELADHVAK